MGDWAELEDHDRTERALKRALDRLGDGAAAHAVMRLPAKDADWSDTGLRIRKGQAASLLSRGVVWLSREAGMGVDGKLALWRRVGDGPIEKSVAPTTSFVADRDGELFLINHLAGQWLDETGRFDPATALDDGALSVAAVLWDGTPESGLGALAAHDETGLAAEEFARRAEEQATPRGWAPLWRVGATSVFCEAVDEADERDRIICRCRADAGILKRKVDVELSEATSLAWSWRMLELPSRVAETSAATHDYLSIAVEFDNGQDLTYVWSAELPIETAFRCPLPTWDAIETHVVVRSGPDDLGRWLDERRAILADYRRAVGGEDPKRIVGVWLIAVSGFQRGFGACDFAGIRLKGGGADVVVGP